MAKLQAFLPSGSTAILIMAFLIRFREVLGIPDNDKSIGWRNAASCRRDGYGHIFRIAAGSRLFLTAGRI
jgi:hypothetical protein